MPYDWGFQNDPNYGKRMDALLFRRAMNTAQDAADDEKRWAARFLSRSIVGIDTADGREYNGNVPMDAGTFFDKMHGFAQTYDPTTKKFDLHFLDSENQKAWDKLPDDLETRFAFAREHGNYSTVNNRLGSAAGRLASAGRVTEEELRYLTDEEKYEVQSWQGVENAPEAVMKLREMEGLLQKYEEGFDSGKYIVIDDLGAGVEGERFVPRPATQEEHEHAENKLRDDIALLKQAGDGSVGDDPGEAFVTIEPRIRELKALAEKRKTVREYERQLAEENSWRTVAAVSPALTDAGREILRTAMAHKDDLKNAVGDDFMRLARENPAEAEKVAAVIHALQPDVSGHTVMGDAMRAMRDTFVNTVQGAAESIGHTFERTIVGGDEYQARREREAMYRRAFSERQKDWGWWGDATIGFFGTLPYMGIAAIPYAGTAAIALSAANDFEKQVVDAGGDVSRPDFFAAKFGVGVVYAAIERAQVIHPLKGLTDFGKARMYANMFGSVSDFLKVAAHQGMRLGGEVWEEGLQGALEKGFVAWGCGQDVAAAAAKGLVQDMHGSIGAFMPLMVVEGAGSHRMYRRGGLTVDETVRATQMMRGFHDQAEITAGDAKRFGDQYGAMAVAWANAGPEAGRRSKALQARFGLNADDAAMADEVLSRLWKAVSATGDKEAVSEFFAGATLKSAADMLKATLRDAKVVPNKDGTQTVSGFIGESGHEVSFTIEREDLALDVTSEAQAPSIVEALNGYGYEGGKLTVEEWLKKPVEERQKLAALYHLGNQGYTVNRKVTVKTKRTLEDGTEEVVEKTLDGKALRILSGDIVLDENTLPQTVFHEAMHGLLKLAEDIAPKELMDALREAYPATAEGETVNEERIANAYRDYLAGKIPAVEYEKDIFDRLVAWIRGLLGLSDASLTIANARTSADVLFNQMLSGDFSGVVEAEKMLDVQLARIERRESGRRAEAEKKEPAPDGGTEDLGKDKFGGEIVAAEDEMVDEDGNVVPPEKMREAIAAGKIVMRREVYEAKKGEIAPNLTDEEKRRAWHLANDDYAGTDEQGRAEVPTPDGAMKVNTQLAVVDRGELITSDDPRFPQDVQNRLGRETSPQVDAIAQAPNPLWLGPAKDTADGAPLVYPWEGGYIVIAGNGRVLGLAKGDDEYKSTDAYNSYARATGERFGLNVPDTAHPRLVRVITDSLTDEQLNRLGRLSNKSGKRAEGAAGTRKSDGMAVRDNLGLVSPDMGASLRSPENSAFAFAVASDIGENGLLTSDEMGVAQSGYDRVENALLGWIVNHHEQRDAIQRALEEQGTAGHPDLGIGNILNGIKASAIHLAALAGAEGREAYDITPDIADALKDYIDFRQGGGTDMDAFLAQGDMFQNRPSLTEAIMREFFARRNSAKRVQAILDKYAETAMLQDNATPTLLDMGETAREDIWKLAVEKADAAEESQRRDSVTGRATSADTDGATADDIAEAARQYAEVVARYTNPDGTRKPGWMMAPNGKPTNLTERQWVQVRTENFKRWFGDWENDPENASKVVDENGEPLVVYHGDEDPSFTVFDKGKVQRGTGFWFASETEAAGYAKDGEPRAFFLNVRKLAREADLRGVLLDDYHANGGAGASWKAFVWDRGAANFLRTRNFDGIEFAGKQIAFSPSQIKSATDNAGTFSEARPDIRYSIEAGADLSDENNAKEFLDWLKRRPAAPMPERLASESPESALSWFIDNMVGRTFVFDLPGIGRRTFKPKAGHFSAFVCQKPQNGKKKGWVDAANSPADARRLILEGKVPASDIAGYVGSRAKSLPLLPEIITKWDAILREKEKPDFIQFLKKFDSGTGTTNIVVMEMNDDGKTMGPLTAHHRDFNKTYLQKIDLVAIADDEIPGNRPDNSATGQVDARDDAEGNSQANEESIPQSGAEGKENLDRRDSVTGARYSIGSIYTGTAADYANRSRQGGKDDGPSLLKVGTGEGSQVYGWGLYASDQRGVAEKYAESATDNDNLLLDGKPATEIGSSEGRRLASTYLYRNRNNAANALREILETIRTTESDIVKSYLNDAADLLNDFGNRLSSPSRGYIYEQTFFTDRAEGDESHLLKWYEDLPKEQVDWIAQEFAKEGFSVASFSALKGWTILDRASGKKLSVWDKRESGETYEAIARFLGSPQSASEFLARAGIDGIKYPVDSYGGNGVKNGDEAGWNYVSFRDDNIRVDHKWVDGQQRFSVTSLMAGGDAARALAEAAEPSVDDIARILEDVLVPDGTSRYSIVAIGGRDMMVVPAPNLTARSAQDESAVKDLLVRTVVGREFAQLGQPADKLVKVDADFVREVWHSEQSHSLRKIQKLWRAKVDAAAGLEELLATTPLGTPEAPKHVNRSVKQGATFYRCPAEFGVYVPGMGVNIYQCNVLVLETGAGTRYAFDIVDFKKPTLAVASSLPGEVVERLQKDAASRRSQSGNSLPQSGAENKQIPQSVADILDGPPAGFRASVTGSAPTGKYGRNDYVVAMAAQDRLRGIDRPPRKYAELAEALGATRFKDDDGSAWVRLADELIEKNRDKLARLAERDIREAVRETARMKAEADFSEHVKKLFTGSARFGEEIGSAGTSAWLKIMRDLAARATGYDLDAMRRDTGADLLLTLMEIMPEKFAPSEDEGKAKGEGGAEEGEAGQDGEFVGPPTPQTWEEWQRNAEERRKHYNTVILLAKEWIKKRQAEIQARENARAKREAEEEARRKAEAEGAESAGADAEAGTDEEGAEPEEGAGPLAIPREVVEAAGVDLQNADEFAAFMRAWICDWLVRQNPGTTYADVLDDETRLATYRRTMVAQLRDIADALLDPTEGKASIMAERMIADIRENASANELERRTSDILGFIQRNAIRQKRKGLIADLLKMIEAQAVRGRKFDALERDMKRKIRGDHEQYCRYIARVVQMSDNAVAKETEALMQIIEGRKADYEQAAAEYGVELNFQSDVEIHRAYEKLAALQQFGGLRNKMPSYIVAASKRLEEWLGNERMEHERRWGEFQAVCDDVAQAIEAGVKARRDKYAKKEPGLGGRMWQDVEASVRQRLEEMLVGAGPERVEAIAKVMRVLSEGSQTLEVKKMEYRRQFEKMMKTAVEGTDLDVKGLLTLLDKEIPEELNDLLDADLYDADGQLVHERQRVRMTWGQAIQLYSSLLQTATYGANIALHGRQDHARAIEEAAHPALIRLAGLMRGIYQERREELSGVVAQVTGLGIFNPDPMYMPAKMNTGVREGLDQKAYAWSPLAKSLTPRVKNRLDFDLTASVMDVFRQRSDESARAIAFGVRGMALRSMLARKSVVDAMARTHGTLPTRRLIEQVTDTLTGGYTLDEARGGIMGLVQSAGTFTTYASLSFNLVTALKQMQSVASWAPLLQGGYLELGRHLLNFDMDAARELCQAPGFVARYGETSFGRMLAAAWADKEGSLITRLARAGMTLIQIGDFVPGILVGQGVYKARVAALLRQNPNADVAAVKEQAATETWALVEECQQTSRLEDTPHMLRRWGVMGKQVTKFATAPIQQVAHEIHTGRMWYEADRLGDKETAREYRRKCINTAIANHVILPAAFYAVATLFGMALGDEPPEEDELFGDLLLQMLVGPFARVFFAGTIVNHFVGKLDKSLGFKPKLYDESSFPAQDTIIRLIDKGFLTASDIANADAVTVANDLLDEIGIVNSPTRYVAKGVRNYIGFDVKKHRREAIAARQKSRGSPVGGGE